MGINTIFNNILSDYPISPIIWVTSLIGSIDVTTCIFSKSVSKAVSTLLQRIKK